MGVYRLFGSCRIRRRRLWRIRRRRRRGRGKRNSSGCGLIGGLLKWGFKLWNRGDCGLDRVGITIFESLIIDMRLR